MKLLIPVLAMFFAVSCPPPNPQPTPTPPPETPHPICWQEVDRGCDCWHRPPNEDWQQAPACTTPPPTPTPTPTPQPTPTPSQSGCKFPQDVPDGDFHGSAGTPVLGSLVNSVMSTVSGCQPGQNCPLPGWTQQTWQQAVTAGLRKLGKCAGQHEEGRTDEIAVAQTCDQVWGGYHVYAGPETGGGRVVWASIPSHPCQGTDCQAAGGGSYRGNTQIPARYCGSVMPTPPPPTTTLPGNAPPAHGECPIAVATDWVFDVKPHGGQQVDLTPYVGNPTHVQNQPWVGCGVNRCPLSCEKGAAACACQQVLFGDAVWTTANGDCRILTTTSSFTLKVADGRCDVSVHGTKGGAGGPWSMFAGAPPCNVGSDGLCH